MKILVLHGENQVESRKRLLSVLEQTKDKGYEVHQLDGKATTKSAILTSARSQTLLAEDTLVFVENFFTSNKKAAGILDDLLKIDEASFIFWEKDILPASIIKKFPRTAKVEEFKVPQSIFKFLESIEPGNKKYVLKLFQDSVEQTSEEFVLTMIARQVRNLITVKDDHQYLKLPEWQKSRLKKQAEKFTLDELISFHEKLLDIDRANKRSELPEGLSQSLEVILLAL